MRIFRIAHIETFAGNLNTSFYMGQGRTWLQVRTDDPMISKELLGLGYVVPPFQRGRRVNEKTMYSKQIKTMQDFMAVKSELEALGGRFNAILNPTGLNEIQNTLTSQEQGTFVPPEQQPLVSAPVVPSPTVPPSGTEQPAAVSPSTGVPESVSPYQKVRNEVSEKLKAVPETERGKYLDGQIENIFNGLMLKIEDARSKDFISSFLEFSTKFWNRSFRNQILLMLQWHSMGKSGSPEYVRGFHEWKDMGRSVKAGETSMAQLRPNMGKVSREKEDPQTRERVKETFEVVKSWGTSHVFDVSQTQPLQGKALLDWQKEHPGKKPFEQPQRDWWIGKQTDDTEKTNVIKNAIFDLASENNIDITTHETEEEMGGAGGYAAEDYISLAYESKGERALATLIHEMAHHLIHWAARKDKSSDIPDRKLREVDAESVAYIVMNEFGFDATHAPNYLALWGANKEDALKRQKVIQDTSLKIISNIYQKLGVDVSDMVAKVPVLKAGEKKDQGIPAVAESPSSPQPSLTVV